MTDAAPLITALVYPSLATDDTHCLAAIYLPQNPSHRLRIVCQPPDDAPAITLEAGTALDPLYVHVPQLADYHALMCRAEAYQLAEAGEVLIAQSPPVTLTWPIHIAAGDDATEPSETAAPVYDTDGLAAHQPTAPDLIVLTLDTSRQTMTAARHPLPLPMVDWHLERTTDIGDWQPVPDEPVCCGTTSNWPIPAQSGWYRAVATLTPYGQPPVVLGISQPVHIDAA